MNIGKITQPIRSLGLMHWLDQAKFAYQKMKNGKRNARYALENPGVAFPPDYMLFEAFQLDYQKYYEGGENSAQRVLDLMSKHAPIDGKTILDWGCGPARIVRHLPKLLGKDATVHGTDYNPKTIAWCKAHIEGVTFAVNQLNPPTDYPDGLFDFVYGISIFTHLSEQNHSLWFDELMRISNKGAILLLSTHGAVFREKLTPTEREQFDAGNLVARGKVVEGHRVFAAFQPPAFVRGLFGTKADILEHIPGNQRDWGPEQDFWILRKR